MFHSFYGPNSKSETYTTHARAHTHMHVCMFAHAHYPFASLPLSPLPKTASLFSLVWQEFSYPSKFQEAQYMAKSYKYKNNASSNQMLQLGNNCVPHFDTNVFDTDGIMKSLLTVASTDTSQKHILMQICYILDRFYSMRIF